MQNYIVLQSMEVIAILHRELYTLYWFCFETKESGLFKLKSQGYQM